MNGVVVGGAEPGSVRFGLLGPVRAVDGAGRPLELGSRRRRALLAALLLHPGSLLPVDRLVDLLWTGPAPATAATMVHGAVAGLRRALGPAAALLTTRDGGYTLRIEPAQLDVTRFEALLADGRRLLEPEPDRAARTLLEALSQWRGPALADLDEAFARDAAARLDELHLQCTELRIEAELAVGRHHDVVAELEALVATHPLRERFCAQLMLACYRSGRQSHALAVYHTLHRTLAAELGLEPTPELRALELAVLRQDDELRLRPPVRSGDGPRVAALPLPISSFVGRERERGALRDLLAGHRLVTLTGPGGTGKSRLAVEVAGRSAADGAEAMLVELAPLTASSPFDETVADALGVRADPGRPLALSIAAALAGRDVLIVLDNCEHLLDRCAALAGQLLAAAGQIRMLATSREPLAVPGERVFAVAPLPVADVGEGWQRVAACDAVRLFADRAAAARPGFVITPDNAALVREVCRRLDGLPLALELAAARAASMPLPDLAAGLDDRFRLLDSAARPADRRHRSLTATVAWSYHLLDADERRLFARLAVFPATFAGAAVPAVTDVPGDGSAAPLARLVASSVLQLEDVPGSGPRYRMLETTRRFAERQLGDRELGALRERHARHYLDQAERAQPHLFRAGSASWLGRLQRESDNLRAGLAWSFGPGGDPLVGVALIGCLWHGWDLRGARGEGLHWIHLGLAATGADRPADRLPLLSAGALLHLGRAEFAATETLAGEQLGLARTAGLPAWAGDALAMRATAAWARGRFDRARQLYEDAIAASIAGGDRWRAAMAQAQLARLHRDRDEPDAAYEAARRSLALSTEVGEELARGLAHDVLASLEHRWGDLAAARRLVEQALSHYRLVGYQEGEASALHLVGRIALAAGERDEARGALLRSLRLCRRIGLRAGSVAALDGLAAAAAGTAAATRLAEDAAALRAEIGLPQRTSCG